MSPATVDPGWSRFVARRATWALLIGLYAAVLLVLLAPVVLSPVMGDDVYYILLKGPENHGSLWQAFWNPIPQAFAFDFQARTTPLAFSERQVLAMVTMHVATVLAIPPFVIWAAIKVALLALSVWAVHLLLREIRFRDRRGLVRGLSPTSTAFITMAFPLVVVVGVKAQNIASLNGWNVYPTLSYGPFVSYALLAVAALRATRLCERDYRRWAGPAVLLMGTAAVVVDLSYEVLALAVPLCVLLVLTRPGPREGTLWSRWRARVTVLLSLGLTYTLFFGWLRWQISRMACHRTDTCYVGTQVDPRARTLWNNFAGSLPGHTTDFVRDEATRNGLPFPGVSALSIGLGVLAVVLLALLWSSWAARNRPPADPDGESGEARGLVVVVGAGTLMALGVTVITGINGNAVAQVLTPVLSYRSNVVAWSALSLTLLGLVRLLVLVRSPILTVVVHVTLGALVVALLAVSFPRNVMSAHVNRLSSATVFNDFLHREVAVGDLSRAGDLRRCTVVREHVAAVIRGGRADIRFQRIVRIATESFEYYHGADFCSQGTGIELAPPTAP